MSAEKTHFIDVDKAVFLANKKRSFDKQYDRRSFMKELGKHHQKATDWKTKTPEIVSVLVKIKELAGVKSIDDIITEIK